MPVRSSVSEMAAPDFSVLLAPDFSVLAIVPNNLGDHEVVEDVVVGLAIQGIAGAAGRAVLLI